jgi:O-methyltransferase
VYRGLTAKLFHYYAPDRSLHLFDTFEGFGSRSVTAEKDNTGSTIHGSHFSKTSLEAVKEYIAPINDRICFYKGYFPDTVTPELNDLRFAFVHLDADLYEPTFEGLKFFYPRMSPGGIIVVHDYNAWAGARQAVDEFFADKPIKPIPMPDKSGSALIHIQ